VLNNACANAVELGPVLGVAGMPVRGVLTRPDELPAGVGDAENDAAAPCSGARDELAAAEVCWTGSTPLAEGWYPVGLTLAVGAAEVRAMV
jgi:hypothetical protein